MEVTSAPGARIRDGGARLGPGQVTLVRALSLTVLLQWAGAGAILPLLPLYVKERGGSDVVVGAVMAAFFAGAFAFQYVGGRLSDRMGQLPVVVGGLAVYAAGSLLFLLPVPPLVEVAFRALQGAGAGAAEVAALAMVSHAVPLSHRGRAVGRIYAGQLGGFAIGPVVGSVAGVGAMRILFAAAASAAAAATVPVVLGHRAVVQEEVAAVSMGRATRPGSRARPERALAGALLAAAAVGLPSGVYEACWTLLMVRHGAAAWEVGLSWSLFAVPFAAMSRPGGWLADHLDRRWLAVGALGWSCAFCACYPFLPGVVLLLALGAAEACGFAIALPACQSLLGEGTSPEAHGHAQGLFASSETVATAVAAACAGAMYAIAPWLPFVTAAACSAAVLVTVGLIWLPVTGRAQRPSSPPHGGPVGTPAWSALGWPTGEGG
jgi:MFS transporter, DHA1 family, multidrug resistance protein